MPEFWGRLCTFALGIARMTVVLVLLTVVLAAGIHGAAGGIAATVPSAEFGYQYDASTETLAISHAGGDPLSTDAVRVTGVDASCTSGEWGSGQVTTDDTCILEGVDGERSVRIVWEGDGTSRAVLDVWAAREG